MNDQEDRERVQDVRSEDDAPESSGDSFEVSLLENDPNSNKSDEAATVDSRESTPYSEDLDKLLLHIEETAATIDILEPKQESSTSQESSRLFRRSPQNTCDQEKAVGEEATVKYRELHHLEGEYELLKEAVRMALDNEHSDSFYVEQLNEEIKARDNLQELEKQWDLVRKSLEKQKWNLLESFSANDPEGQLKLQKLKELETEVHSVLSEIRNREEECAKLAADLEKQPKAASRRTYVEKITEITKNSRKLDADIERILKDTRELKLESNSVEERLHRTYAVVNETVFREAKKDSVSHQVYRVLTSIHESFEEIREKILATDKTRREVAELEAKLSAMASRSLDMDKLQADLDAMRMENERLEKTLENR